MSKKLYEYLLLPFAGAYGLVIYIRNKLFDWQILPSTEFNLPVISVGNLVAGGTGKTPHIEYLANNLKDDYHVAVLSRGYKRKTRGFVIAETYSDPQDIGDEPCQIKRKFPNIIVAVSERRVRGIRRLLEMNPSPDVILLDDAYQHRYVKPGLSILLDDYNKPFSRDFLLPCGRLREPSVSKKRANIILITKSPSNLKTIDMKIRIREIHPNESQHLFFTRIVAGNIREIFDGNFMEFLNSKPDILLISGIASPGTIKPLISGISPKIKEIAFRDHHNYTNKDAENIIRLFHELRPDNRIILTTEKDAVKIKELEKFFSSVKDKMFYFPITIEFFNNDEKLFLTQLHNYVTSNQRNRILYKEKD